VGEPRAGGLTVVTHGRKVGFPVSDHHLEGLMDSSEPFHELDKDIIRVYTEILQIRRNILEIYREIVQTRQEIIEIRREILDERVVAEGFDSGNVVRRLAA
jgi:hypothetical protein